MDKKYIVLDNEKRAVHKFKDGLKALPWDKVKDFDNLAMIVPEPFIVLDFDTISDADIIQHIINDLDLKCKVMQTSRGVHVWFKSIEPWKNFTKTRLAIGVYSDCRSHSRNAYVKIKDNGVMRKWLRECDDDEVMTVPKWLHPVSQPGDHYRFKDMGDGSGRNQELFSYIVYLQSKGFKRDEVKDTINVVNRFVLAESLPQYEVDLILRDEAFKSDEEIEAQIAEKEVKRSKFEHNIFADELLAVDRLITYNDKIYIYRDGYYQPNLQQIERQMIAAYPGIKWRERNEVIAYMKIMTSLDRSQIKKDPYIVNLKNTRLNLKTCERLPYTPDAIEFERIPVNYDPEAKSDDLDLMLNRVFCGDRECINLFEEIVGDCLLHKNIFQTAFLFYGSGSNGKSTILKLIRTFIGLENCATISLEQLTGTFITAELENKLVNIGDDINYGSLKETGTLKKLFSGEPLQVQRKFGMPFTLEPYATQLFSANEIPRSADKTDGMMRKLTFIPFNAKFSKNDDDYDPMIFEKITSERSLSYLLNLANKGLRRLLQNKRFTTPKVVDQAKQKYMIENSTVLTWVDEMDLIIDEILNTPAADLYMKFTDWCKISNIREIPGKKSFNRELIRKFGLEEQQIQKRTSDGTRKRFFVVGLD